MHERIKIVTHAIWDSKDIFIVRIRVWHFLSSYLYRSQRFEMQRLTIIPQVARNFSRCARIHDYDGNNISFACADDISRDVSRRRGEPRTAPRFSFAEQSVKSRGTTLIESSSERVTPGGTKVHGTAVCVTHRG